MYRQMLAMARPPVRPADFEEDLRKSIVAEKLQAAITGWIRVSDADVEASTGVETRKSNSTWRSSPPTSCRPAFSRPTPRSRQRYTANQESYRVPEKRRVRYLAIDAESLRAKMTVLA